MERKGAYRPNPEARCHWQQRNTSLPRVLIPAGENDALIRAGMEEFNSISNGGGDGMDPLWGKLFVGSL